MYYANDRFATCHSYYKVAIVTINIQYISLKGAAFANNLFSVELSHNNSRTGSSSLQIRE